MSLRSNSRGYVQSWTAGSPSISWPTPSVTRPAARILARSPSNGEAGNSRKEALRDVRHVEEGVDMSKSWISRSRSYGLAYYRQPFKGRTHGHRVEQNPEAEEALVA